VKPFENKEIAVKILPHKLIKGYGCSPLLLWIQDRPEVLVKIPLGLPELTRDSPEVIK
jgi:hypothetical protein